MGILDNELILVAAYLENSLRPRLRVVRFKKNIKDYYEEKDFYLSN